jgi:hypothetical protein
VTRHTSANIGFYTVRYYIALERYSFWTCYVHIALKIRSHLPSLKIEMLRDRFKFPLPILRLLDVCCIVIWRVLCAHPETLAVSISSASETVVPFYETRRRHVLKVTMLFVKEILT